MTLFKLRQMLKPEIIKEANSWIGTPYHHGACLKHVGVDCIGLIIGINSVDLGRYRHYGAKPNPKRVLAGMYELFDPAPGEPGDIALIAWRADMPMHLAILDHNNYIIHADGQIGRVVKHRLNSAYPIHSYWTWRTWPQ